MSARRCRRPWPGARWCLLLVALPGVMSCQARPARRQPPLTPDHALPRLSPPGSGYRTPLAGEGFQGEALGESLAVQPRDRSTLNAWHVGLSGVAPGVAESAVLPMAAVYLWRRPDDDSFTRALIGGVRNEVVLARSNQSVRPVEGILTLSTNTLPIATAEYIDGLRSDDEELYWGYVRPGVGVGYRESLDEPGHNDNMLAFSLVAEPGLLYFDSGHETSPDFIEPEDTFEGRVRLQARLDALERNLLELPHTAIATGSDFVYGVRGDWKDWGIDKREAAVDEDDYLYFTGYMLGAGPLPFLGNDRHRVLGSIHGGAGDSLDRFSGLRVGGGARLDDYEGIASPIIPGAFAEEFNTSHYTVAVGEYRWEALPFAFLSLRGSLSYVDRDRWKNGEIVREDDLLSSVGARLTTGFFLETRLLLDYNYNFQVIRKGEHGGHEVVVLFSGAF